MEPARFFRSLAGTSRNLSLKASPRARTTPADRAGAFVDFFPTRAAFPKWQEGRHPHWLFRGLLRLHACYRGRVCCRDGHPLIPQRSRISLHAVGVVGRAMIADPKVPPPSSVLAYDRQRNLAASLFTCPHAMQIACPIVHYSVLYFCISNLMKEM
jgi:hypothetical protein